VPACSSSSAGRVLLGVLPEFFDPGQQHDLDPPVEAAAALGGVAGRRTEVGEPGGHQALAGDLGFLLQEADYPGSPRGGKLPVAGKFFLEPLGNGQRVGVPAHLDDLVGRLQQGFSHLLQDLLTLLVQLRFPGVEQDAVGDVHHQVAADILDEDLSAADFPLELPVQFGLGALQGLQGVHLAFHLGGQPIVGLLEFLVVHLERLDVLLQLLVLALDYDLLLLAVLGVLARGPEVLLRDRQILLHGLYHPEPETRKTAQKQDQHNPRDPYTL
jgi:hypothetical protein